MIISVKSKNYEDLVNELKPNSKVIVLSCNNCAKKCMGLGGRVGMKALSDKLVASGVNVVRQELIGFACAIDLIAKRKIEESTAEAFRTADTILTLACEDGEVAVRNVFPDKEVPNLSKTLGIGWGSPVTGVRLTNCIAGIDLEIEDPALGISIKDAADRLGLPVGSY